jgi:peptide deformylase
MSMLPIRTYPDPILRVRCPEVTQFDDELKRLAENMVETMIAAPGIGLAAPQVGVELRLAVVDLSVGEDEDGLHVFVNPEIVDREGQESDEEGCLSIPGVAEKVKRPTAIRVKAKDLAGEPFEIQADGLFARAICHEVDHLDGILFVDRVVGLRKERVKRQLRRLGRHQEMRM